jgi:hypothetical protein
MGRWNPISDLHKVLPLGSSYSNNFTNLRKTTTCRILP